MKVGDLAIGKRGHFYGDPICIVLSEPYSSMGMLFVAVLNKGRRRRVKPQWLEVINESR